MMAPERLAQLEFCRALILLARELGVRTMKVAEVEFELAVPGLSAADLAVGNEIAQSVSDDLSPDEALFGSAQQPISTETLEQMLTNMGGPVAGG